MAKYKVYYSGFAYVEANSVKEAEENYEFDNAYEEKQICNIEEVDDFDVCLICDRH